QADDGIRYFHVTGVQTCALPIFGIAPNRSMEMLYYNQSWLDELREQGLIDFEGPPTTPEQFEAAACAASENAFSGATATGRPYELGRASCRENSGEGVTRPVQEA